MDDLTVLNQNTTVNAYWQKVEPDVTHGSINGYLTVEIDCGTDAETSDFTYTWHITDFNTVSQATLGEAGIIAEISLWDKLDETSWNLSEDTDVDAKLVIPASGSVTLSFSQTSTYIGETCPDKGGNPDMNYGSNTKLIFRFRKPDKTVLFQSKINLSPFKIAQLTKLDNLEFSW